MMPRVLLLSVKELANRGLRSSTVRDTFWIGSATVANGLLGAACAAVYARALGLADYGTFLLTVALFNVLASLADLGIGSSIVRFGAGALATGDRDRFRLVYSIGLRAKLLLGGAILLLALIFLKPIAGYVFNHVDSRITFYFSLALVAYVLSSVAAIFPPLYQSFKEFRRQGIVSVVPSVSKILILLLAYVALARLSVTIAIGIEIASILFGLAASYAFAPLKGFTVTRTDKPLRNQLFSFNKWLSLYFVITIVGTRLDIFFVGGLSDARALGMYGAASKITSMFIVVANSYLVVLLPELSSSLSVAALRQKLRHASFVVGLFSMGIAVLALLARPLIILVFGAGFQEAIPILQTMCFGLWFTVLGYPINATLFALNKSYIFPLMSGAGLVTMALANIWLIPLLGPLGAAIAFSASAGVSLLATLGFYLATGATGTALTPAKPR